MLLRQDVSASIVAVICNYFKFTIQAPGAPGDNHVDKLPKGNLFKMKDNLDPNRNHGQTISKKNYWGPRSLRSQIERKQTKTKDPRFAPHGQSLNYEKELLTCMT